MCTRIRIYRRAAATWRRIGTEPHDTVVLRSDQVTGQDRSDQSPAAIDGRVRMRSGAPSGSGNFAAVALRRPTATSRPGPNPGVGSTE